MDFQTHLRVVCGHIPKAGWSVTSRVFLELRRVLTAIGEAAVSPALVDATKREAELILTDARCTLSSQADPDEVFLAGSDTLRSLEALQ